MTSNTRDKNDRDTERVMSALSKKSMVTKREGQIISNAVKKREAQQRKLVKATAPRAVNIAEQRNAPALRLIDKAIHETKSNIEIYCASLKKRCDILVQSVNAFELVGSRSLSLAQDIDIEVARLQLLLVLRAELSKGTKR